MSLARLAVLTFLMFAGVALAISPILLIIVCILGWGAFLSWLVAALAAPADD